MTVDESRLRTVWVAGGLVATAAGMHTVLAGLRSVPGEASGNSRADSELRFYSAFYAAQGIRMLRTAAAGPPPREAVSETAGALFLAGLSRALSWHQAGRPALAQIGLMAVELVLPPLLVTANRER